MKKILVFIVLVFSFFSLTQHTYANDIVDFFSDIFDWDRWWSSWGWYYWTSWGSTKIPYNWNYWIKEWTEKTKDLIKDVYSEWKASDHIQSIVIYLLKFLALLSILVIIFAWFYILTAWTDEEKVSKWKKIIFYVILWMIIIFLAWPITYFILNMFQAWA